MTHDAVICGAGPAGSVIARRLAAAGVRVALVDAAARPRATVRSGAAVRPGMAAGPRANIRRGVEEQGVEGLSARSLELLAEEGVDLADVIAGPLARRGVWAGGRSVEGREWLIERAQLAEALRACARAAGADYRPGAATSSSRERDRWRIGLRGGGTLAAPLIIDARGRRGAQRRGPVLLAIGQRFRSRAAGPAGTGIGVTDAGWCWWAQYERMLWVQVVGRPHAGRPASWLAGAAAQVPELARALEGACAAGTAVARAAHARLGAPGNDPTLWRVGDAAFALDPLSGQGVFEALRGARLAATAILSVLTGGETLPAHRFITLRHEDAWANGVRAAAGFYGENAGRGAFWSDTAAAYQALLPQAASSAAPGCGTRIERRPVLENGRIRERDVMVTARQPRGAWQVDGVPLVELKSYVEAAERATILGAAAALGRPPAAVASAMHWLREAGGLPRHVPPRVSSGG